MNHCMGSLIVFSGPQGTGKTTAAYEHAAALKKRHPNKSVTVLAETARVCPYPINLETTPDSQLWIFAQQLRQELTAIRHYDMIVCDRCAVDVAAYTRVAGYHQLAQDMLGAIYRYHRRHYTEVYLHKIASHPGCLADDGVRCTDPAFQAKIEAALEYMYLSLGLHVLES